MPRSSKTKTSADNLVRTTLANRVSDKQYAFIALLMAFYIVLFLFLYPILHAGAAPLGILPVLIAGWLLGRYGGLVAGLVMNIIVTALFWIVGFEIDLRVLLFQALPPNIIVPAAF